MVWSALIISARAGMKVRILEARNVIGGAAVTEEFHPGFRNSTASYTVSLLQPKIIADMGLVERGYRVIERPKSNFLPLGGGEYLLMGGSLEATQKEITRFSAADAARLPAYYEMLESAAAILRELALEIPPNAGGGAAALLAGISAARRFTRLPAQQQHDILKLFTLSARELLDQWFESTPVKAAFGFDSIVGNYASPDTPGSAYVLLHHVFGEINGKAGQWGHVIGGMGRITQLMAAACEEAGVEIRLQTPVRRLLVENGTAVGLETANGEQIRARKIVANVGPKLLYDKLIDNADLPAGFRRMMDGYQCGSGSFRMNLALDGLPDFSDFARTRRSSEIRDHHGPLARLYGPGLSGRPSIWLGAQTGGRDADPQSGRRQSRSRRPACRKPLLSAICARIAGRSCLEA